MMVHKYIDEMRSYIEAEDFAGYDPYDALNSPVLDFIGSGSKWLRIGLTQFLKRCPVNLRPILGIQKEHNSKAVGLFIWSYAKLYHIDKDPKYLVIIDHLLSLIKELKIEGYSGNCWGYNFDWQSRTYFRPKGTPTIVNTSIIGHALLDCFDYTHKKDCLDLAIPIKDFILNDLYRTRLSDTFCFSYTPIDTAVVHNANMLGASILIRLKRYCSDSRLENDAIASISYSLKHQRKDGSWYYADTPKQKWIDSFHTGYNLQALRYFMTDGYVEQYQSSYEKGVEYYARNFFLEDGTPKYFNDKIFPIDIHAPAQAIAFFSGMGDKYESLSNNILNWMLKNMYSGKGFFYYQKKSYYINRIPYMRWCQAWALHALTQYLIENSRWVTNGEKQLHRRD